MNLQINDLHKACIQFMNQENIRYLIDDDYQGKFRYFNENAPTTVLQVWLEYPRSLGEQRLINKLLKEFKNTGDDIFFNDSEPYGQWFQEAYYQRNIVNYEGLTMHFIKSASLAKQLAVKTEILVDVSHKHRLVIAALNLYNAEYLVIDQYPIANPISDSTGSKYMVLWLNPTRENASQVRKANQKVTGNPPSINEMSRTNRRFVQGTTYWSTFYGNLTFSEAYQRRCILNIDGQAVHFLHPDDLIVASEH